MNYTVLRFFAALNRMLSTVNGFIFGILIQFSPVHSKSGRARKVPVLVNVLLLLVLIVVVVALLRANGPTAASSPHKLA